MTASWWLQAKSIIRTAGPISPKWLSSIDANIAQESYLHRGIYFPCNLGGLEKDEDLAVNVEEPV